MKTEFTKEDGRKLLARSHLARGHLLGLNEGLDKAAKHARALALMDDKDPWEPVSFTMQCFDISGDMLQEWDTVILPKGDIDE